MKRNQQSSRAMRNRSTSESHTMGTSKYALKYRAGKQMYGGKSRKLFGPEKQDA